MTIIHHEGRSTKSEIIAIAKKFKTTGNTEEDINSAYTCHETTKNINRLVARFEEPKYPYIILIEGAPGIGKTILSKEIAFEWARKGILNNTKLLFLLFMCDPRLKYVTDVQSMVKHFCQSDNLTNKVTDWLIDTSGEYLTIVFDGYDEMSAENKNSFIVDGIIGRQNLPKCGIIITSRPVATAYLHDIVDCRAEVLGFSEEDRQSFIQDAFVGKNDKIEKF